jgi:hypothetical protein
LCAVQQLNEAERNWNRAMIAIYDTSKRELNYNASRFIQMISQNGGLATARQLLWTERPSDSFAFLWEHGRLELTVEAHILRDEFEALFTDDDRHQALTRLEQYGWPANQHQPA